MSDVFFFFFVRFGVSNYSGYTDKAASDKKVLNDVFKGENLFYFLMNDFVKKKKKSWRLVVSFRRFAQERYPQQRLFCGQSWRHVSLEGRCFVCHFFGNLTFFFF